MGSEAGSEKEKADKNIRNFMTKLKLVQANWKPIESGNYFAGTTAAGEAFRWGDPDLRDYAMRTFPSGSAPIFQPQQAGGVTVERQVERVTSTTTTRVAVPPHSHAEIIDFIDTRIDKLRDEIMSRFDTLETLPIKVVEGREVSSDVAIELVRDYFEKNGRAYPSDIASALGISLESVVKAMDYLKEKGIIQPKKVVL